MRFIYSFIQTHYDLMIAQIAPRGLVSSPGILRFRSQTLPTEATEAARWRRLTLSRIRPSPVTFTLNGLPVDGREKIENAKREPIIPFTKHCCVTRQRN